MSKVQPELRHQSLRLIRDVVVAVNKERPRSTEQAAAQIIEQEGFRGLHPFVDVMAGDCHTPRAWRQQLSKAVDVGSEDGRSESHGLESDHAKWLVTAGHQEKRSPA
jgi:hypothetical protein